MKTTHWSLILVLFLAISCPGCAEEDGAIACLLDGFSNASARLDSGKVELLGSGSSSQAIAPSTTGPKSVPQWTLRLDIGSAECSHHLTFMVRNPGLGVADMSSHSKEIPTFTGLYTGDLGSLRMVGGSTFEITSYGSTAAGRFSAVLEDGTVFRDGQFSGVQAGN